MKLVLEEIISAHPCVLGRDLLKRAGFKGHYVDENEVADFLGYSVKEISSTDYQQFPDLGEIFDTASAHLFPDHGLIIVNKDMPKVHKRLSIFHESGHDTMPTHIASALSCHGKDLEPTAHKQMEKEAFLCGAEIMFPLRPFVDDSTSVVLGTEAIQKLARRYKASVEATAIRYAATHQDVMAMLMIQPMEAFLLRTGCLHCGHSHPELQLHASYSVRPNGHSPAAPLRVQYFVRSYRFPKFISSGTEIREGNIIFDAWQQQIKKTGEVHASALSSSAGCNYFAECQPLEDGRIMVLIWLPNKQGEFWKGVL